MGGVVMIRYPSEKIDVKLDQPTHLINPVLKLILGMRLIILIVFLILPLFVTAQTVYFQSNFETGDLSEWNGDEGGGIYYEPYVKISTEIVHRGKFSVQCNLPDPSIESDAKLLRWRIDQKNAYYSAWFYFDENYKIESWSNIMQWKTKQAPDRSPETGDIEPTFVVMALNRNNIRQLTLYHWPVGLGHLPNDPEHSQKTGPGNYQQSQPIPLQDNTWIHIEAYYKTDRIDGEIIIWQDGIEVFKVIGVNTQDSVKPSNYVMFGIGNYISSDSSPNQLLYVDDVLVTDYPISVNIEDGNPSIPKNFRIVQ